MPFFNLFCLLDIFSAFYDLICFLIFCLAFRLDRSFVNRYFAILIRFQSLVLPCFLSLNSWGRAASSERTIAIIACMFCNIFASSPNATQVETLIDQELLKVKEWCVLNRLSINFKKTPHKISWSSNR